MKNTKRIAISGIMAATSVVIMYFATVTDLLSLSGVVFAAFAVMFIYIEYGGGAAVTVYGVVSVISFLILPDKVTALLYAAYVGYYPMLKAKLERLPKAWAWALKLVSVNVVMTAALILSRYVAAMEAETPVIEAVVFILGNVVFVLADVLATRLITVYFIKYRPRLRKRGII